MCNAAPLPRCPSHATATLQKSQTEFTASKAAHEKEVQEYESAVATNPLYAHSPTGKAAQQKLRQNLEELNTKRMNVKVAEASLKQTENFVPTSHALAYHYEGEEPYPFPKGVPEGVTPQAYYEELSHRAAMDMIYDLQRNGRSWHPEDFGHVKDGVYANEKLGAELKLEQLAERTEALQFTEKLIKQQPDSPLKEQQMDALRFKKLKLQTCTAHLIAYDARLGTYMKRSEEARTAYKLRREEHLKAMLSNTDTSSRTQKEQSLVGFSPEDDITEYGEQCEYGETLQPVIPQGMTAWDWDD